MSHERSERFAGSNVPNNDVLAFFIDSQGTFTLFHGDGLIRPRGKVLLARREFDQADERMRELSDALE